MSDRPQESLCDDEEEEPKTRAEFLKYSCEITPDPDTANPRLLLSEGNRKATKVDEELEYPVHPDRFVDVSQVMKDISRTGTEATFGFNKEVLGFGLSGRSFYGQTCEHHSCRAPTRVLQGRSVPGSYGGNSVLLQRL